MRITFLFCLAFFISLSSLAAQQRTPTLRAGAFAQDITPSLPISLNGGMADRAAKAVHDPLHARCLVIDDGKTTIAFAVCDSCMIPRDVFDEAKKIASAKTGIPTANMLFSSTHTHTAPTATGVFQSDPDEGYRKLLIERIAQGIIQAHAQLEPAKIGWAIGSDDTQVFNRRWLTKEGVLLPNPFGQAIDKVKMNPGLGNPNVGKPAGPIDPQICMLSLQASDGRPIALLTNYSLHYVGGVPGDQVSADYYGMFATRIAQLLEVKPVKDKPAFVAIMSNGTSGDINNVNFALRAFPARKPGEQAQLVADSVAEATHKAYQTIKHRDDVTFAVATAEIELAVRKPTDDDLAQAKMLLEKAKSEGPVLRGFPNIYARETVLLAEYPDKVHAQLQAIRIGELAIAAIPCEVFVEIGLNLKKQSPFKPTFTISLANGYLGYLPTPAQHELGGYETWRARSSFLEVSASDKIESKLMELFKQLTP